MNYTVEYLQKARSELIEAWKWYEDKQPELGDKFTRHVESCIRALVEHPERYPERKKNYREAVVKTFPYLVIYRINNKKKIIAIVSIFHTSRSPRKKHHQ